MFTHFLTLELDWLPSAQLQAAILTELSRYGEPLRWAVVEANRGEFVKVEAVVTSSSRTLKLVTQPAL